MIDYSLTKIEKTAVHFVGNKHNEEELIVSKNLLDISDDKVRDLLFRYFLKSFTNPEYYSFDCEEENYFSNTIYSLADEIFKDPGAFLKNSGELAKHLYNKSEHPQIKPGDLFVVHFAELCTVDEITEAIGIFKSENKDSFLKLDKATGTYSIRHEDGINVEKLDKGCIIFNTDKESGYKVCIIDKSGKGDDAYFWKDSFLNVKPYTDSYHFTRDMMTITKKYITEQLDDDFDINKAEQIDLLNRSADYFRNNERFEKDGYVQEVFRNPKMIRSFNEYDSDYRNAHDIYYDDTFDINPAAVKRQIKIFKGVLKLDRNFHIYIHGDKNMIVPGTEPDGRKFYKVYYENEE